MSGATFVLIFLGFAAFTAMLSTANLIGTFILALRAPQNPKRIVWLTFTSAVSFACLVVVLVLIATNPAMLSKPTPPAKVKTLQT